jgi:hypothetical protein
MARQLAIAKADSVSGRAVVKKFEDQAEAVGRSRAFGAAAWRAGYKLSQLADADEEEVFAGQARFWSRNGE